MNAHEQRRLAALHEYRLLDAPADDELTTVVRIAATVAGVPFATLNLIDENRQCQLTTTGFAGADSDRRDSMCAIQFETGRFAYVPDASLDPLYRDNPWVTGDLAKVRFYASVPLVTPQGYALGTLCVFDEQPGTLDDEQIARLTDLGRVLVALFERRRQARINADLAAETEQRRRALERAHADLAAANAELERSNAELTQFAGVVSHDLAAPLTVVRGYLELLADTQAGDPDPRAAGWIDAAARAVVRMRQLIESLLGYAAAGQGPCRLERVELGTVAGQALLDLRPAIEQSGAVVAVAPGLPAVPGDPTLLRQLLQNLIGNALKYQHPDRRARVDVTAQRAEDGWVVSVADNGAGIAPEDRDRAFEMFTRVGTAAAPGHGVGLSTCQRIVERHGGRIRLDGRDGGGTVVSVMLPDA